MWLGLVHWFGGWMGRLLKLIVRWDQTLAVSLFMTRPIASHGKAWMAWHDRMILYAGDTSHEETELLRNVEVVSGCGYFGREMLLLIEGRLFHPRSRSQPSNQDILVID